MQGNRGEMSFSSTTELVTLIFFGSEASLSTVLFELFFAIAFAAFPGSWETVISCLIVAITFFGRPRLR